MTTPFEILKVPTDADDATIKKAYLARVREFPPERNPERFQVIRSAYETVRDSRDRMAWHLFNRDVPDPSLLLQGWLAQAQPKRPDLSLVHKVLAATLKTLPPINSAPPP